MVVRFGCFVILLALLVSCSAYKLDSAQSSLRSSFATRDYTRSASLLEQFREEQIYKSKDGVLLNLEQGTVSHFAGNYRKSNSYFSEAEEQINFLFTKSISRAIKSFLNNDNTLDYDGEDYEDIYLNVFKSLNYIHLNELDAALVEARRIAYKLGQLDLKYSGLTEALSRADTTGHATWKTGESNVENSAYGHYLSAILYAKTGNPDDARIEYEHLLRAFDEQPSVYSFDMPDRAALQKIRRPESYNMLISCFSGRAPLKIQNDARAWLEEEELYLKFSLPTLRMFPTQVARVEAVINDTLHMEVELIEEMDVVARDVYRIREPIIHARALVRSTLKAVGTHALSKEASEQDETLGELTNILGIIGQEATEKADLRSWQTMPGKAYATVVNLPPGNHQVTINYLSPSGHLLFNESRNLEITPDNPLNLVESLYWN